MISFFYFLQLLYNWPRVLIITWNSWKSTQPLMSHEVNIVYTPGSVWNSVNEELLTEVRIECSGGPAQFKYQIFEQDEILYKEVTSPNNLLIIKINPTRNYHLKLFKNGLHVVSQNFPSFWLAAIGDSFSSGQGNPDLSSSSKWLDERCYRSTNSFVYQTYRKLAEKCSIFTFLSCSGASVDHGILSENGQVDRLRKLIEKRGSPPDALLLTIGGNDIGFTDVLSQIQEGVQFDTNSIDMRFFYVFHQLDRIAQQLSNLGIPRIIVPTYYDITRNENGDVDASCGLFGHVSKMNLMLAERRILHRLNDLLRRKAIKYGWITVDSTDIFRQHGLCSTKSLIRSRNESLNLQGNEYGSFHPNTEGHRLISEKVLQVLI